jgi:chaperone required for assembly of F1-ATPase
VTGWAPKRFWTAAAVVPAPGGHGLALDGKPVRTPAKAPLVVPSLAMAREIAAEWDAQQGEIRPQTMPMTRAANSAIDRVAPVRAEVAAIVAGYAETDLICYRAEAPQGLAARQAAAWDPLLTWAEGRYGAPLVPVTGVMYAPQPPASVERLAAAVDPLDPFRLAALHDLVAISGSLVLGLAVMSRHLPAADAWPLSRIDEEWQAAQWGHDEEAMAAAEARRTDFLLAARMLDLLEAPDE